MSALGVEWLLLNERCVRAVCTAPFPALVIQPRQAEEELLVLVVPAKTEKCSSGSEPPMLQIPEMAR
jgi:mRNA-degrading endonuclease toxin of MazEF toxin-antitoxin module